VFINKYFHTEARLSFVMVSVFLIYLVLLSSNLLAFERRVLFEDFTSTTCRPCAQLAPEVHAATEMAGDRVTVVEYHVWWPQPGDDPWYEANPEDARERVGFYEVNAAPTFFTDGAFTNRNGHAIEDAIMSRAEEPSPLNIHLRGYVMDGVLEVAITITSEAEMEEDLEGVRLQVVLKEDYIFWFGGVGQEHYYHPMVKMIPDGEGIEFDIGADEVRRFTLNQDMQDLGWHQLLMDNLSVVAWVQEVPGTEVYQAQERSLAIVSPYIQIVDLELFEGENHDGDGRVEAGELGDIVVTLATHEEYLDAESIEIRLSTDEEGVQIEDGVIELDGLAAGERIDNADNPLRFQVPADFEPHLVNFTVNVIAQPGDFECTQQIVTMIGWPSTLMVDASGDEEAAAVMTEYFGSGNLPIIDRWDRGNDGEVAEGIMQNYSIVFWHSFNNDENVMSETEEQLLIDFLDAGGIFIASSSYLAVNNGDGRLFREYISAVCDQDDTNIRSIIGSEEDPYFGDARLYLAGSGSGIGSSLIQPGLRLSEDAQAVMYYEDDDEHVGVAAVFHETDTYRTLYFAFPFESISGRLQTEEREEFFNRIWSWIDNPPLGLTLNSWEIFDETDGDGDGRAEPGESVELIISIMNFLNSQPMNSLQIRLSTEDAGISITEDLFEVEELSNGESVDNAEYPFRFEVNEAFEAHPVTFRLSITAQPEDYEREVDISFMVDYPPVLLIDASGSVGVDEQLTEHFGINALPYVDQWNRVDDGNIEAGVLENYPNVLWHSFNNEDDVMTDTEEELLMSYLDEGGTLIVSSSYLPINHGESRLVSEYLSVSLDNGDTENRSLLGDEEDMEFGGSIIHLGGEDGENAPLSTPSLTLLGSAQDVMFYSENAGIAAVKHEADQYRTLLLAFPLESISENEDSEDITSFLSRIWEWINNPPLSLIEELPTPNVHKLDQPFPNPFNSQISVSFHLYKSGRVRLSIYDIDGREVALLDNSIHAIGDHKILWNAEAFSSGVYFLRFSTAELVNTAKIVLIK